MSLLERKVEGGVAFMTFEIRVGAALDQKLDELMVAVFDCINLELECL